MHVFISSWCYFSKEDWSISKNFSKRMLPKMNISNRMVKLQLAFHLILSHSETVESLIEKNSLGEFLKPLSSPVPKRNEIFNDELYRVISK